mgnify:CR=1 FL=1
MKNFLEQPSRYLFFTGKGGVGKTAIACASAIRLAEAGKRILLVSTDPASNLDEMLGIQLSLQATAVPGVDGLSALNIDPELAATHYRERVISPYRAIWTEAQIAELQEQLAGACTVEIAAFDEFAELLAGDENEVPYDHVLFDTAPTGHTLRLLQLPGAWTTFLQSTTRGASCLGPHSGLKMEEARFSAAFSALSDPERTIIVLVTRPDRAALREIARSSMELAELGLHNQQLVINAVFAATDPNDRTAAALEERGRVALLELPDRLHNLCQIRIPLRPFNMVGLPALRGLLDDAKAAELAHPSVSSVQQTAYPRLSGLIDEIAQSGKGLVMVMGKGGVGKTTIAAAIAVELASRGKKVHLSTTDPAAHLAATLEGSVENLSVSRIDPVIETQAYVDQVMSTRGTRLSQEERALLAEDLRSPCYEEIAVFTAFSRLIMQARSNFVVLDTAPTGHTLLLLDATGAYHRQVVGNENTAIASARIVTPLMKLRDPNYTKILLVTLAETTPVSEAARLQADLKRAGVEPYAWVINSSLAASGTGDPCLTQRVNAEITQIDAVRTRHAHRFVIVPWMSEEPVGPDRLLSLARDGR